MTKHEQELRELKKRMDAEFDPNDPDSPDPHLVSWMDARDNEIWDHLMEADTESR